MQLSRVGLARRRATERWLLRCRPLVAAIALGALLGGAVRSGRADEPDPKVVFRTARDQGVHYYKRRMYAPALASLQKAAATPRGQQDYRTQLYLARSAYEQLVLEVAIPAARRALEIAEDLDGDEREERARALVEELEGSFGGVTFSKDPDQTTELKETYIHLKDTGGLINVKKKKVFGQIRDRFRSTRVTLPTTLYLPFGQYTANGAPFEVKKGATAQAKLFMYLDEPGLAWWWYAGIGTALVGGGVLAAVLLLGGEEEQVQAARFDPMPVFPER